MILIKTDLIVLKGWDKTDIVLSTTLFVLVCVKGRKVVKQVID
ncbi:hypothetical protein HMPREF0497_2453 [Lentilactobacillus buchneri ATCC 11577]|nr:hypothetical protein HMPREF0497_2453 [Lentilactobacillus buchneri ATCC 11577]